MFAQFRVLPFEERPAIKAMREASKMNLPKQANPHRKLFDLMIAATAWANGLTLMTENAKDFQALKWVKTANW